MKKKTKPINGYLKKNNCPYCGHFCDAATMIEIEDEKVKPKPGDLSFCIKCTEPSIFKNNMKLEKFDLNDIDNLVERNRLKIIQLKMREFLNKW